MPLLWDDLRLVQAAEAAAESGCDCAGCVDVVALVQEVRRLRAENGRLRKALEALVPFTEEMVDGAHRPADIPIMMNWPPLAQARRALAE